MAIINNEKYSLFYQRLSLIYQKPEVKASLEVILSVFTVMLLIFAAIRPTLTNIASLQKKIEDLESANKKADVKLAQVFSAQTQLNSFQNKLVLYDEAVPDGYSHKDIAGRVEVIARKHGLEVKTISIPGTQLFGSGKAVGDWAAKLVKKDADNIIQTRVDFVVTGNPQGVEQFLREIENLDRLTLLNTVVMSTENNRSKTAKSFQASGQIYFYFYQGS